MEGSRLEYGMRPGQALSFRDVSSPVIHINHYHHMASWTCSLLALESTGVRFIPSVAMMSDVRWQAIVVLSQKRVRRSWMTSKTLPWSSHLVELHDRTTQLHSYSQHRCAGTTRAVRFLCVEPWIHQGIISTTRGNDVPLGPLNPCSYL